MVFFVVAPFFLAFIEVLTNRGIEERLWNIFSILFIIGLSHAIGSRCVGCMVYDDYANIYQFQAEYLSKYGFTDFKEKVNGVTAEFFFYFLMWVVSNLLVKDYWLAGLSFYSILFLYLGLKNYFTSKETIIIIALSSIGLSTQLIRQYIGWSFLFMSIVKINNLRIQSLFVFLSFWIHHSSLILLLKSFISRYSLKVILISCFITLLFSSIIINKILTIDYYSITYLLSESPDSDIFNYNRSFMWRIILIIPMLFIVSNFFKRYIVISIALYFMLLNLPLIPVRFNLLLLSHGVGLLVILLIKRCNATKVYFLYLSLFIVILYKLYFIHNSENPLWESYNIFI